MAIATKEELEQLLEDIQSRLSVIETAQTKPEEAKEEASEEEPSEETTSEESAEVETEDEIEKLLNA